ncbi:hypothetical protein BaRGS_00038530 [Batillaria attramentaria]|uniref:Immunoglobulin subtype domain-containing protein n=1 Tax=Batillaria attramentaria TaxID=370345 RepID=A0ABD0J5L1_9CAEN
MSKKQTVIQVILFVAVSTYIPAGEGIFTACTATNNGTAGRVGCTFSADIKESKQDFMIQRYDLDSGGQPVDVLTCIWTRAFGQRCDVSPTYQFDYKVSSEVGLDIPNIAKEHEGMYMCLMIPPDDDHVEVCEMRIVDRGTAGRPKATTTMSAREVPQTVVGSDNQTHYTCFVFGFRHISPSLFGHWDTEWYTCNACGNSNCCDPSPVDSGTTSTSKGNLKRPFKASPPRSMTGHVRQVLATVATMETSFPV